MNDVINNSTKHLTPEDAHAMAAYIKSLPADESKASTVSSMDVGAGSSIYKQRCEKCHLSSGRGGIFSAPPLTGSAVVQAADPASLINIILYGPETPREISFGGWESMKPYFDLLNDAEVAAVANYVRGSWGNSAASVSVSDVTRQR